MFENHSRGWHGSYSNAGRTSAEQYHMIINKDRIIYGRCKKLKVKNFFAQKEEPDAVNDLLTQQVDIFEENHREKAKRKGKLKLIDLKKSTRLFGDKLKPLYTSSTPTCTKYNPKMNCILKRSLSGPNWEKVVGRVKPVNEVPSNDLEIYLPNESSEVNGRNFVEMKHQTQRGPFRSTNDVRYRTDVPFELPKFKKSLRASQSLKNINGDHTASNDNYPPNSPLISHLLNSSSKQHHQKKAKQFTGFISQTPLKEIFNKSKSSLIKGPDFKKTISRAYINFLNREKKSFSPSEIPNHKLTSSRTISLVSYDKSLRPKAKKDLRRMRIDPSLTYSYTKLWKTASAPNFNLMISRPNDNSPLPFYMQQTYDRNSFYMISSKTLKMNNYANGTMRSGCDLFSPKKSYNKMIDLNLLSSDQFISNALSTRNALGLTIDKPIAKVINYYHKNLDDTATHEAAKRFDSITLKAIPRNGLIKPAEKKRFEVDFNHYP